MAETTLKMSVRMRWWVMPFLRASALLCKTLRIAPDVEKLGAFLARHGFKYKLD